jgi:hypothetical protein
LIDLSLDPFFLGIDFLFFCTGVFFSLRESLCMGLLGSILDILIFGFFLLLSLVGSDRVLSRALIIESL